ncbi:MAG TPA: hypothetical protein VLJ76_05740, partial [Gaiellaceae bacterium]|nr:hypothetical protein [Gaiellaceae bacterium]
HVALVGGQGGAGGYGATVAGDLAVTGGEVFYVAVGANGSSPGSCGPAGLGGFNGGGDGGAGNGGCAIGGYGGGGASDLRTCSRSAGSCSGGGTSLDSRLLVAGGGGGTGGDGNDFLGFAGVGGAADTDGNAGTDPNGGSGGGGLSGENGGTGGAGGNLFGVLHGHVGGDGSAGTGGTGGTGDNVCCGGGAGGGGGGYVGGGGGGSGTNANPGGGGGGGSSYVDASASNGSIGTDATGTPSIVITYTVITDQDPPAVTVSFTPDGSNGWFKTSPAAGTVTADDTSNGNSNVTDIQCTGASVGTITGVGTPTASAPITVSSQGTTNVNCTATDSATNNGAGPGSSASASVKLDSVAPSVTRNASADNCATPGNSGWCKGSQTAGFSASDATSGVTSPCSGASCNFTQSSSTNGSSVSIPSGSVCDVAGNCNSGINATGYQIDTVAPGVSRNAAADSCTAPGNSGWCKGSQTAGFTGSDATSGVTSPCSGSSCNFTQSTSTNGTSISIPSGSVCDVAGNCNSGINATGYQIDSVAPSVSRNAGADSCASPGNSGWCKGSQTAGFSASDSTSGVTSPCSGASCNFTQSSSANGSSVSISSGSVCDVAGKCASAVNATGFKIDTVAPALGITNVSAPADGTLSAQNLSSFPATVGAQPVTLSGTDGDATSGISSVTVEGGGASLGSGTWSKTSLPLSTGSNTLHVTVTDVAGNTTSSTAGVTLNLDLDGDGIANNIDQSPNTASTGFSDAARGGTTSGTVVLVPAGMTATIVDAPSPQGVQVTVTGPASGRVRLQITGKGSQTSLAPGTYIETDPNVSTTLQTISGLAELSFTLNGSTTLVDIPTGATAELTETITNGMLTQAVVDAEAGTITINGQPVSAGTNLVLGTLTRNALTVSGGKFSYTGTFTLGATSNGIKPLTEFAAIQLGPLSFSLAPGSFKKGTGGFTYTGTQGGAKVSVLLTPVTSTKYAVTITGSPSPSFPTQVPVQILVGDDSASTVVARH